MKRLVLCTLHRTFPKIILVWNLFKQISVFLKLTILKTLKLFLFVELGKVGAVRYLTQNVSKNNFSLMGYLKSIPSNLSFCYLSSLAKSTNKTKISLVFSSWRKICDEKTCSVYLTQNVSKNNFGLKFVQTNFSVFKIDNFKNTKIILALSGRLMGYLKYPIKS